VPKGQLKWFSTPLLTVRGKKRVRIIWTSQTFLEDQ
jgi:hypothetical protein